MNFSAEKARRKWPYDGIGRAGPAIIITAATALLLCTQAGPAAAARKFGQSPWQSPWSDLFWERHPRPRRAALPAPARLPLPKPRPADAPVVPAPDQPAVAKQTPAEPGKPVEQAAPAPPPPSACRLALTEDIAIAPSIPDIHGAGGCGGEDLVRLEAVVLPDQHRVSIKPAAILRCTMASAVAGWIRTDVAPLAASLGSVINDLDNLDSYECRGRNGVAGAQLSEHGRANALDVRDFKLANGQTITLTDRAAPRDLRENVLHSACARFSTVLGPGSDSYHEEHIHLDLMERHNNYKICQWNVWDPLPPIAPMLPAERPQEAPPRQVAATSDADKSDAAKSEATKSEAGKSEAAKSDAANKSATSSPDAGGTRPPTKKRRQNRRF